MMQPLEAGVPGYQYQNLFLGSRSSHRGGERFDPLGIPSIFLLGDHAPEGGPEEWGFRAPFAVAMKAKATSFVRLALSARDAGDESSWYFVIAFDAKLFCAVWSFQSTSGAGDLRRHLFSLLVLVTGKDLSLNRV